MKTKFSTKWRASKQPRKQRKYLANAPLHLKKKFIRIHLEKKLRAKHKKRNIQARKGDIIKIMKGKFKGKTGKIVEVMLKKSRIIIEGIQVKKQDGSKVNVKMQPSNLQIIEISERAGKNPAQENMQKKQETKKETQKQEMQNSSLKKTEKTESDKNKKTQKKENKQENKKE